MTSKNKNHQRCRIRQFHNVELGVILRNGEEYFCLTQLYDRLWPNTSRMTTFNRIDRLKCKKLSCTLDELNMLKGIGALGSTATRTTLLPTNEVERLYNYTQEKTQRRQSKLTKQHYPRLKVNQSPGRKKINAIKKSSNSSTVTRRKKNNNRSILNRPKIKSDKTANHLIDSKVFMKTTLTNSESVQYYHHSNPNQSSDLTGTQYSDNMSYSNHNYHQRDDNNVDEFNSDEWSFQLDKSDDNESSEGSILTTSSFLLGLQSATSISSDASDDERYTISSTIDPLHVYPDQEVTKKSKNGTTKREELINDSGKNLQRSIHQDKKYLDTTPSKEDKVMKDVLVIRKDKSSKWLVSSRLSSQSEEEDIDNIKNDDSYHGRGKRVSSTVQYNHSPQLNHSKSSQSDGHTYSPLNIRIRREGSSVSVISSQSSSNSSMTDYTTTGTSLNSVQAANDTNMTESHMNNRSVNNLINNKDHDDDVKAKYHGHNKQGKQSVDVLSNKIAYSINNSQLVKISHRKQYHKKNINTSTAKKSALASLNRQLTKSNFSIQSIFDHSFPKLTVQHGDLCPANQLTVPDSAEIDDNHPLLLWEVGKEVVGNKATNRRKRTNLASKTKST